MLSTRKFKNVNMCTHPFCLDCIAKYIDVKVKDKIGHIECPGLNCKHPLDPIACRSIISRQLFEGWCNLLCDLALLDVDRCYCPHQNCSALVLNECRNKLKKVDCPNCKKSFCFHFKVPWHRGFWCSESEQFRDGNEVTSRKLIEDKKWTRCLKCGHSIERVVGCRVIKCRCGATICHNCGGTFHFGPCDAPKSCGRASDCWTFTLLLAALLILWSTSLT